jgi:hypothetical protein
VPAAPAPRNPKITKRKKNTVKLVNQKERAEFNALKKARAMADLGGEQKSAWAVPMKDPIVKSRPGTYASRISHCGPFNVRTTWTPTS